MYTFHERGLGELTRHALKLKFDGTRTWGACAEMPGAAMTVYDEMDALGVELDAVACSALFTVFNQYGQPEKTLSMWSKRRENFQFGTSAFTQLSNACSM